MVTQQNVMPHDADVMFPTALSVADAFSFSKKPEPDVWSYPLACYIAKHGSDPDPNPNSNPKVKINDMKRSTLGVDKEITKQ